MRIFPTMLIAASLAFGAPAAFADELTISPEVGVKIQNDVKVKKYKSYKYKGELKVGAVVRPDVEIAETDTEFRITAELPGFSEREVDVELTNNVLTIKGETNRGREASERAFGEYYHGRVERRIALDCDVAEEQVAASFRNGVLTVTLPKLAVAQRTKRIPINGG